LPDDEFKFRNLIAAMNRNLLSMFLVV